MRKGEAKRNQDFLVFGIGCSFNMGMGASREARPLLFARVSHISSFAGYQFYHAERASHCF